MPIPFLKHAAAAFCIGLLATAPAEATQILNFTYAGNGGTWNITGSMEGALALDGNTFVPTTWLSLAIQGNSLGGVNNIPGLAVYGMSGPSLNPIAAVVTLDGSSENFSTYPNVFGDFGGLRFQTPDVNLPWNTGISIQGFGGSTWVQSAWHASVDMPEPASLALFGLGAAALGMVRRRRA